MKPSELRDLLGDFYREKAGLRARHAAAAQAVEQYDFNNTYQYIIAREDQQLDWLRSALVAAGGVAEPLPIVAAPSARDGEAQRSLMGEDAGSLDRFVERWRARIGSMTDARNKLMLDLILGECVEHGRLLRQGAEGRLDLLGRRTGGERTKGVVLSTRWVE